MTTIGNNLQHVQARIAAACAKYGRPAGAVQLLAVSKTFGADAVREAMAAGQYAFGENYIQEAVDKITTLHGNGLQWHCIGPVQSNKSRLVAEHFDWVHTVDRLKLAERLSTQRPPHLPPLNICLQVNVSGEASKSGCTPAELPALAQAVTQLPGLRLRGLMTIPEPSDDPQAQRAPLARLRQLRDQLHADLDTLSMGMSQDLEAAIAEGATWVRIGTALFGARDYGSPSL